MIMKTTVALKGGGEITMQATYFLCLRKYCVLFCVHVACVACIQASEKGTYFVWVNMDLMVTLAAICLKRC